jgi:hypothetical protein
MTERLLRERDKKRGREIKRERWGREGEGRGGGSETGVEKEREK